MVVYDVLADSVNHLVGSGAQAATSPAQVRYSPSPTLLAIQYTGTFQLVLSHNSVKILFLNVSEA